MTQNEESAQRQLISPEQFKEQFWKDWKARTWWGKIRFMPIILMAVVIYPPLWLFHRAAELQPDTYKEDADVPN